MTYEYPAKTAGKRPGRFKNKLPGLILDRWPSSLPAGKILGYFLSRLSFQDVDIVTTTVPGWTTTDTACFNSDVVYCT